MHKVVGFPNSFNAVVSFGIKTPRRRLGIRSCYLCCFVCYVMVCYDANDVIHMIYDIL